MVRRLQGVVFQGNPRRACTHAQHEHIRTFVNARIELPAKVEEKAVALRPLHAESQKERGYDDDQFPFRSCATNPFHILEVTRLQISISKHDKDSLGGRSA